MMPWTGMSNKHKREDNIKARRGATTTTYEEERDPRSSDLHRRNVSCSLFHLAGDQSVFHESSPAT